MEKWKKVNWGAAAVLVFLLACCIMLYWVVPAYIFGAKKVILAFKWIFGTIFVMSVFYVLLLSWQDVKDVKRLKKKYRMYG